MPLYLIGDTIWYINPVTGGDKWTVLPLLIAYVMGIHTRKTEYRHIKKLGRLWPQNGRIDVLDVDEVSDHTFYAISKNYIGYEMPDKEENWALSLGTNKDRLLSAMTYHSFYRKFTTPREIPESVLKNGVHDISLVEYWKYYTEHINSTANMPTKPNYIDKIYAIIDQPYTMFLATGKRGTYYCQGGKFIAAKHDLMYYYTHLKEYSKMVERKFARFWFVREKVSCFIRKFERFLPYAGVIHGCIIDVDWLCHIYINPIDGKITPYYAESTSSRIVYSNLVSMLYNHYPEILPEFYTVVEKNNQTNIMQKEGMFDANTIFSTNIIIDTINDSETDIYKVSRFVKNFDTIYNTKIVTFWDEKIVINESRPNQKTAVMDERIDKGDQ